jgi:hypothetical protein
LRFFKDCFRISKKSNLGMSSNYKGGLRCTSLDS